MNQLLVTQSIVCPQETDHVFDKLAVWGPHEPVWAHVGPYGPMWTHMGPNKVMVRTLVPVHQGQKNKKQRPTPAVLTAKRDHIIAGEYRKAEDINIQTQGSVMCFRNEDPDT